jgi:hypothetical protein
MSLRRRRQRWAAALLAAVLAVLVVGSGLLIVRKTDDNSDTGESPEQTVRRYFAAFTSRDCDTLIDLGTERAWSEDGTLSQAEALQKCRDTADQIAIDSSYGATTLKSEDGDQAVVEMEVTNFDGGRSQQDVQVRKDDGRWKVDQPN